MKSKVLSLFQANMTFENVMELVSVMINDVMGNMYTMFRETLAEFLGKLQISKGQRLLWASTWTRPAKESQDQL